MSLKKITTKLLFGSGLIAALYSPVSLAETVMKVATWLPPTHVQNAVVWPTWAKWVEEATEGRVKVELEYGMGHPKSLYDLVEDGVVDAAFSYHGYVPGRFKLALGVEQPLLASSGEAASVAYWRVHEKYFAEANEHMGLKVLGVFAHGPAQMHLKFPIKSLKDLEGKKIRVPGGLPGVIGERMHITPVNAPAPKAYELLQQGVVDGIFMPAMEQKSMRLSEVAPYLVLFPHGIYSGSLSYFINEDFLDGLAPEDREAILAVSGEKLSRMTGAAWDKADQEGIRTAEESGVQVLRLKDQDPLAKEFAALVAGMDQQWLKTVADSGVDAKAALKEMRQISKEFEHQ